MIAVVLNALTHELMQGFDTWVLDLTWTGVGGIGESLEKVRSKL